MSDIEKVRERPPVEQPQEKAKEPNAPKTSQSAFDKVLEQQKTMQQSPVLQQRSGEQSQAAERVVRKDSGDEKREERRKDDKKEDSNTGDRLKQKVKSGEVVTRNAVVMSGQKRQSGGGSDRGGQGAGSDASKKQMIQKKLAEVRETMAQISNSSFASKLAQAAPMRSTMSPQQMQTLVNHIVASVKAGKNELGESELKLVLKESMFKGLHLRFTSQNGKVQIQFESANREVRALFEREAPKIRAALEERGVAVSQIKVK